MRTRIAAALAGLTLAAGTLVGTAVAVPEKENAKEAEAMVSESRFSDVICRILDRLDLLDSPDLADLVELLGCEDDDDDPSETTTKTTTPAPTPPAGGGRR